MLTIKKKLKFAHFAFTSFAFVHFCIKFEFEHAKRAYSVYINMINISNYFLNLSRFPFNFHPSSILSGDISKTTYALCNATNCFRNMNY